MPPRRPIRLGAALIAATLAIAPAPALALQNGAGDAAAAQPDAPKTADIDFPGGTVAEYIETLRRAFDGKPRNVLMDEETARAELDSANMRSITLSGALQLMSDIFPERGVRRSSIRVTVRPGYLVVQHVGNPFDSESEGVPSNETRVFSIRGMISPTTDEDAAALRTEDILTAVELVITASSPKAEPEIRFHPETGMLIVAAPRTSLGVVTEAIELMTRDTQTLREQAAAVRRAGPEGRLEAVLKGEGDDPELRLIELRGLLQMAELKLEQAKLRVEQAEYEHKRMKTLYDRDAVGHGSVSESDFELRNRQLEARMVAAEVERIRRLVEHTEQAADPEKRQHEIAELQRAIAERYGESERLGLIWSEGGQNPEEYGELMRQRRLLDLELSEMQRRLAELTRRPRRD